MTADPSASEQPMVLDPEAAARRIGVVTEAWLRRKAGEKRIPCTRFMGRIGFTVEDCDAIVAQFHAPAKSRLARR